MKRPNHAMRLGSYHQIYPDILDPTPARGEILNYESYESVLRMPYGLEKPTIMSPESSRAQNVTTQQNRPVMIIVITRGNHNTRRHSTESVR